MDIRYSKVIVGNYAAVPVEDPFDSSKTAYWLYKENYSICVYLFSCEGLTNAEIQKRLSGEELAKSIALLETRWRKEDDPLIYGWQVRSGRRWMSGKNLRGKEYE